MVALCTLYIQDFEAWQGTVKVERYHHPAVEQTVARLFFSPHKKVDCFKINPEAFQPVSLPTIAIACTLVGAGVSLARKCALIQP